MAVTAALSGHGLLLGYSGYVDAEVAAGALVYPFDLRVPTGKGYHLVYRKERLVDPRVRAFREWVKSEAAGDGVAAEQAVRGKRSEEGRVGKEGVSTGRSRWSA